MTHAGIMAMKEALRRKISDDVFFILYKLGLADFVIRFKETNISRITVYIPKTTKNDKILAKENLPEFKKLLKEKGYKILETLDLVDKLAVELVMEKQI